MYLSSARIIAARLSAYMLCSVLSPIRENVTPCIVPLSVANCRCRLSTSKATMNIKGDSGQPCLTERFKEKQWVGIPLRTIADIADEKPAFRNRVKRPPIPILSMTASRNGHSNLSKALVTSNLRETYSSPDNAASCNISPINSREWWMFLPGRKANCWGVMSLCRMGVRSYWRALAPILYAAFNKVIGRLLVSKVWSDFLGSNTI